MATTRSTRPATDRSSSAGGAADHPTEWTVVSTSPPPACSPSRSARTRSPTTWRTRRRPATRPTAPRSATFGDLLLANSATGAHGRLRRARPSQVDQHRDRLHAAAAPRHRRAARLRDHRRRLLRRPDRPGHRATRATASSPSTPQGRLVTAAGRPGARPQRPAGHASAPTAASTRARSSVVDADQPAQGRRQPRHRHARGRPAPAQVRAGALEGSGADAARSMVDMIASLRAFEAGQKVIQTIDETLGKAATPGRHGRRLEPARRSSLRRRAEERGRMLEGLNTAAAGMAAQQQRIDAVANDLANANTTGYKHVRVGFRDLLYDAGRPLVAPRASRTGAGAAAVDAGRAFEQGALQRTGQPLDVAHPGRGLPPGQASRRPPGAHARRRPARRRHAAA